MNGKTKFPGSTWLHPDSLFHTDACLTGVGGYMNGYFFHHKIPEEVQKRAQTSNQTEIYGILIAIKAWRKMLANKNILVYCDNTTSVTILGTGRSQCDFAQDCLREIRYWSALHEIRIRGVHLPGKTNTIADALSRWHKDEKFALLFAELTKNTSTVETPVENLLIHEFW